jgi:hypothetical protein
MTHAAPFVRYYFDSVTGSVIAVAKEGVRVLQEIMPGAKKAPAEGESGAADLREARARSLKSAPREWVRLRVQLLRSVAGGRRSGSNGPIADIRRTADRTGAPSLQLGV